MYSVVWQSAAALLGSFAIAALTEKGILSLDVAISLIAFICFWFLLNIFECSYWYNRNLCIIANIERQFLCKDDLKRIQYYFGAHRPHNRMTAHLKNQCFLGWALLLVVLGYHFAERIVPGFNSSFDKIEIKRCLPYLVVVLSIIYLWRRSALRDAAYNEFQENSPGSDVDTNGVIYGVGHGHQS
jgi:hypothetical protein